MEVMPMTQACADIGRHPRNGAKGDDEAQDADGEAAASYLYGMLGYRAPRTPAITTQQWLAFSLIDRLREHRYDDGGEEDAHFILLT